MKTPFLLAAQYDGIAVIPVDFVARDYFGMSTEAFVRKVNAGDIAIPLVRMEASKKAAKGVHLQDLAAYIDERAEAARKECRQLNGR